MPNQAAAQGGYYQNDRRGRNRDWNDDNRRGRGNRDNRDWDDRDYRWDDRDARNDRDWGRRYSRQDIEQIIRRVEDSSDRFTRSFDRALDRSRLDGSSLEDRLNNQVKQLENRLDDLRDDFDRRDDWRETRQRVSGVMREAGEVNSIMRRAQLRGDVQSQWSYVKRDLNRLASTYNLRPLR
jgi:hypothetical protein